MKPGYIIADVTVANEQQILEYRRWSTIAMRAHDAEIVVRGGPIEVLEGPWHPTRLVILKFPSMDKARAFYHSHQYRRARNAREGAAIMRMVLVEGL